MSKIIEIHRHYTLNEMSQEDPQVKAWLGESYKPIGPYMDGKVVGSGLSFDEQKYLLPEFLGIESDDKNFRIQVTNFYHGFLYKVEKDGLKLEIGLQDDSKPLSRDNLPLVLSDYVKYRHALGHPHVKGNRQDAEREYTAKFYIHDPNKVAEQALTTNTLEDKALSLYMKYKDSPIKVDQVLTMLGINTANIKKDKVLVFKENSKRNAKLSEFEQKETLRRFIDICEDKDLEIKFVIEEAVGFGYLKKVGTNILFSESGKTCGENMADAVLYFNNPKNSRELNMLKAEYEHKSKKARLASIKEKETLKAAVETE